MQFRTTNAAANFQRYITNTIREALDDFVLADLDDILIYSNLEEEHEEHIKWVMQHLLEVGFYLKPNKCEFHKETIRYLGLIISTTGILMDENKVETVRNWSQEEKTKNRRLNNLFKVHQFLGFCNHYWHCLPKYSEKAEPLRRLTKKNGPFWWESEQQLAVVTIVTTFASAQVLQHFYPDKEVLIETDVSEYLSAGVLSQYDDRNVWHPVAYFLKKHTLAECI